ncbi:MAG: hypothetical protein IT379_02735 [Deltaproteobacteria bacterium]|nr:hypothetical protein [Deltaproteobacteria bacterium]
MPLAKGVLFVAMREHLRLEFGDAALSRVVQGLPGDLRDPFRSAIPSGWYPEELVPAVVESVFLHACAGSAERLRPFVQEATRDSIGPAFRLLARMTSPEFVVPLVPRLWSGQHDTGEARLLVRHRGRASLELRRFPQLRDARYRDVVAVLVETVVGLAGGAKVQVQCTPGAEPIESVRIDAAWA